MLSCNRSPLSSTLSPGDSMMTVSLKEIVFLVYKEQKFSASCMPLKIPDRNFVCASLSVDAYSSKIPFRNVQESTLSFLVAVC